VGKLLGKVIRLKSYTDRTNNLTVVPVKIIEYNGDKLYECIIVHGNTLQGKTVGDYISLDLDFHSDLESQGCRIIDLTTSVEAV
jgi:hypothetical protein